MLLKTPFDEKPLTFFVVYLLLAFSVLGLGLSLRFFLKKLYTKTGISLFIFASVSFLISGITLFIPMVVAFLTTLFVYIEGGKGTGIGVVFATVFTLLFSVSVLKLSIIIGSILSAVGFLKMEDMVSFQEHPTNEKG
ncbi:MAG: hypothetical protein GXO45_05030 [Aquificae bacterium]|nr:hypothetical protein [Aquificota bacterium]